jgi:hypothetical protein
MPPPAGSTFFGLVRRNTHDVSNEMPEAVAAAEAEPLVEAPAHTDEEEHVEEMMLAPAPASMVRAIGAVDAAVVAPGLNGPGEEGGAVPLSSIKAPPGWHAEEMAE